MIRSGLRCLAAIDIDPVAIATLRANLVERQDSDLPIVAHALDRDLRKFKPDQLAALIGTNRVDAKIAERQAASRYLKALVGIGVLREQTFGKEKLFVHPKLMSLLTRDSNTFIAYR